MFFIEKNNHLSDKIKLIINIVNVNSLPRIKNFMKTFFSPMLIALIFVLTTLSCNNEEIFSEDPVNTVVDPDTSVDTDTPAEDTNDSTVNTTLPCSFGLDSVQSGDTVVINCMLDLGGQTVDLPPNVTIVYEGGDIINGTLNFSDNSVISDELLNPSLTLSGTKPLLKDTSFNFDPQRWGIVEGKVNDEVASKNREILNSILIKAKDLGITTFTIDKMDAYFDVSSRVNNPKIKSESAILIPSDFELKMSANTYIRVQPNNAHAYALIMVYKGDNINISGGNLLGDRWEHDYSPVIDLYGNEYKTHEWGHMLQIAGGKNITVDGVDISDATGDGFDLHGSDIRNLDGTPRNGEYISENVTLKNCIVNNSRRNGLSLLDGNGILIENCSIKNTGLGENPSGVDYSSAGTWPKYGVSFEAWRVRNSDGTLNEYEKIENVTLRGNTFTGNSGGDIVLYTCSFVTIEDNYFDSKIANKASNNITIKNNTMEARVENGIPQEYGILLNSLLDPNGQEFNNNYTISGNKINGYKNAMILSGENYEIYNNILTGFKTGISLGKLKNSNFYNNDLNTNVATSYGYSSRGGIIFKVNVNDEKITATRRAIDFYNVIANLDNNLIFDNCKFVSTDNKSNNISDSENITIKNSQLNTQIDILNSINIQLINNN